MWGEYLLYPESWEVLPYMFASIVVVLFVSMFTVFIGLLLTVHQIARDQGYVLTRSRNKKVLNPTPTNGDNGSATEAETAQDGQATEGTQPPTNGPQTTTEDPIEIIDSNEWNRIIVVLVNSTKLYVAIVIFLIAVTIMHLTVIMAHELVKCWKFAMWDAFNDTMKIVASNIAEASTAASTTSGPVTSVDNN